MDQVSAQVDGQAARKVHRSPATEFKPGKSANPGGVPSSKPKPVDIEADRLVSSLDYRPSPFQLALIRQLAALNLRPPTLDTARVMSRIMKQLGFGVARPAEKPAESFVDYCARVAAEDAAKQAGRDGDSGSPVSANGSGGYEPGSSAGRTSEAR